MFGFFENTIPCPDCDGAPNHFSFYGCRHSKVRQRRAPCKTCGDNGFIDAVVPPDTDPSCKQPG